MRREFPDTGALRSDLLALFGKIARRADAMTNAMIAGVMGEAFRHPEVAALLHERLKAAPLAESVQKIVDRAAERGELPPTRVPSRAGRVPLDLVRNESMLHGTPVAEEAIAELVDEVYLPLLRGLAAG
jgi:hypothetical protein